MTIVPPSIRQFRLVYGLVVLLSVINVALMWPALTTLLARYPQLGAWSWFVQATVVIVGLAIPVSIWWFAGWRRSAIARIVLVLVAGWAVFSLARVLVSGRLVVDATMAVRLAGLALQLVALWLLFRRDARPWFARRAIGPTL